MTDHLDPRPFGAVGDGVALDTPALQRALDACAHRGGTVVLPPGTWRSGSLRLGSRTTLHLEAGAVLLGSRDPADYPMQEAIWEGRSMHLPAPLLWAKDATDVAVTGAGTIDGQGQDWWAAVRARRGTTRPRLVAFLGCRRVRLSGLRLTNSPSWTVHPWRCQDVRIADLTIVNPPDAPNTDGIDPESCADVHITGCLIDVGDDAIVLKAGASETGETGFPPCERVLISGCSIVRGHGGVVIGSEMSGGVRDVVVSDCVMHGTDRGIRIKTRRGRGGAVENLTIANVLMREVGCPLVVHAYYRYTGLRPEDRDRVASRLPQSVDAGTPLIRGLRLSGISAEDVTGPCLGVLYGLPERPIAEVSLRDCRFRHRPEPDPIQTEPAMMVHLKAGDYPTCGLFLADVTGLALNGVDLQPRSGPCLVSERVAWQGQPPA